MMNPSKSNGRSWTWTRTTVLVISIVVVALLASLMGALLADSTLNRYVERLEEEGRLLDVARVRPQNVSGSIQTVIDDARAKAVPSVRPIISLADRAHRFGPVRDVTVGQVIILTNDGWVMLPSALKATYGSSLRIVSGDEVYHIETWIVDDATGMAFAKTAVEGTPATFGSSESSETGDAVFVVGDGTTAMRLIDDARSVPVVERSDVYERFFVLDAPVTAPVGSFVANATGSLVGVLVDDVHVRPLHQILPAFDQTLANGAIDRGSLGVSVVDESRVVDDAKVREGMRYVAGFSSVVEIGDVILRVNGEDFAHRTLSEMVLAAKPGDELLLVILRDGTEHTVSVTLE